MAYRGPRFMPQERLLSQGWGRGWRNRRGVAIGVRGGRVLDGVRNHATNVIGFQHGKERATRNGRSSGLAMLGA